MNKLNKYILLKELFIPTEVTEYVQRLNFELESYRNILSTIITSNGEFSYNKELYELHMKNYINLDSEYKLAMNELVNIYGSEFSDHDNIYPKLNFLTNKLQLLTSNGECQKCDIKK